LGIRANAGAGIVLPDAVMMAQFQALATTSQAATIWAIDESGAPGGICFQIGRGRGTDAAGNANVTLDTVQRSFGGRADGHPTRALPGAGREEWLPRPT